MENLDFQILSLEPVFNVKGASVLEFVSNVNDFTIYLWELGTGSGSKLQKA